MGAMPFVNIGRGRTAEIAFFREVGRALVQHGFDGYTGTIAEKYEIIEFQPSRAQRTIDLVRAALDYSPMEADDTASHEVIRLSNILRDKWGPAVVIELMPDEYEGHGPLEGERLFLFAGWPSS